MHKDIKFPAEKGNTTINYQNLTLTVNSKGIDYKIYRKPYCTGITIQKDSFCSLKHKMATKENFCRRTMTILEDEEERKKVI